MAELERTREEKAAKVAARLKAWKDDFHVEAGEIVGARNARQDILADQVRSRQMQRRRMQEQMQWARDHGGKYLVSPSRGGSASPHAMSHAPAPSLHHAGMGH